MKLLNRTSLLYILGGSIVVSIGIFLCIQTLTSSMQLQIIRSEQVYAFLAFSLLYFTLLAKPFYETFKKLPFSQRYLKANPLVITATAYFALIHACFAFFGQLGGFNGLRFLGIDFLLPVSLGLTGLIIIIVMSGLELLNIKLNKTSMQLLSLLGYSAGIAIIIHFLLLGTHFSDLHGIIPQITFIAISFLLLLLTFQLNNLVKRYIPFQQAGIATILFVIIATGIYMTFLNPFTPSTNNTVSFDIHAAHKQLAQLASQQNQGQQFAVDISKLPGLDGDRNKRYTVSMTTDPVNPAPNQNTTIHFKIYDASTGNQVTYFKFLYAKKMHLIIVNSNLSYFEHIHPEQDDQGFSITTQFPSNDVYHIYIEYQPFGGIEQQVAFTIPVGDQSQVSNATQSAEPNIITQQFGNYDVTLNTNGKLSADNMTFGNQKISFTITDAKTHKSVTTLEPYLASFGHLTMINEQTYDFIHVHPYSIVVPPPNATSGPTVDFLPIGIYGPFKPGVYRVFAEFNPNGTLITTDFTVKVEK